MTTRSMTSVAAIALAGLFTSSFSDRAIAQSETTLTIATVNNPQMVDMQHQVADFTKSTGIKVNFETLPENTLRQKVTVDIATGGGQFDIATVGTYEVPIWAKNKWIVDLSPFFDKMDAKAKADYDLNDVIPSIRKGLSYDNALYALPFYGESSMTFYNKKLFKAAGLTMPEHPTWDQIAGFAKKLNDPAKNLYGICLRGLPGWGEMGAPMTTVINTFGGQWFDMSWKPTLDSGATKDAITFYLDTIKKYGEPGASSAGFTECETNFTQGKTAIWVDATSASGLITDPKNSPIAADVGFAYAPTKVTPNGSHWLWAWSLTMEGSSKHKDEAFKFLTWATNKHYVGLIAADRGWGNVPPGTRLSDLRKSELPGGRAVLEAHPGIDPDR